MSDLNKKNNDLCSLFKSALRELNFLCDFKLKGMCVIAHFLEI